MNILIVGSGSIASKHRKNIDSLGHNAILLKDLTNGINTDESSILDIYEKVLGSYDAVVIANASNKHFIYSKIALNHKKILYLEKPPCLSVNELKELIRLSENSHNPVAVGFQLRFSKGLNKLKKLIEKERERIIFFDIHVGQALSQWRENGINEKSYYANRSTGGGVLYELCHEIDIALWMFGSPKSFISKAENLLHKDMKIEDFFHSIWKFKNMTGIIHMDMIDPLYKRYAEVIFDNFKYVWNIDNDSLIKQDQNGSTIIYEDKTFERKDLLNYSMQNFLSWIEKKDVWKGALLEEYVPLLNFIKSSENEN